MNHVTALISERELQKLYILAKSGFKGVQARLSENLSIVMLFPGSVDDSYMHRGGWQRCSCIKEVNIALTEHFCKVYNPKDEHLLAGSCHSGQVVWWDTRAGVG